ncbi:M23 family metallopeptidase [Sphingomonas sp. ID0503]|uniref:M23 family metallopeptidase n=1 Tax=Sphingomonas sp. ID0503 TaxID=3399691 RepID=UPI003AFA84EF
MRAACGLAAALSLGACAAQPAAPPKPASVDPVALAVEPLGTFRLDGTPAQGALILGQAPAGVVSLTLDGRSVPIAPDGRFMIGFGRDAPAAARLEGRARDGRSVALDVSVAARSWDIQSLPTLAKGTTPTPEFLARRKVELEQIAAARAKRSDVEGWRQRFVWPATGRISGVYGSQRIYAGEPGAPHSGVDIARPSGTPVAAPADGVVVLAAASPFTLEGNLLIIDHGMGLNSAFLHLSRIDVKPGDRVRQGQPVGAIGMTGRATGPHLHWAMMWQDQRVDPERLVPPMAK